MGKKARLFPTGTLKLHIPQKVDKGKLYPIYLHYNWHCDKVTRQTGYSARIDDWDEHNGKLRRQYGQDYQQVNNQLASRIKHYDAMIADYVNKYPNQLSLQVLRDILDDKALTRKDKGSDFHQFVIDFLLAEYKKNKVSWSRTKNGISTMNGFRQFLQIKQKGTYKEDSIYLGEISDQLINDYIAFRREYKHNTDATINHALTPIIKACRYAAALELIDHKTASLIEDCRIAEKEDYDSTIEEFDGKYLNDEQLKALTSYCNEGRCHTFRQREYIEMFLFAFHACGMRVSDVITLKWRHINFEKNTIKKVLIKTHKRNEIPLTPGAAQILLHWRETHPHSEFVFGFLPDDFDLNNAEALYKKRNSATAAINQSLTAVGHNIGLAFGLTFHRARHSFAMYALNNRKMSMSQVSQLLGHRSTEVTERVYARYLPQTIAPELMNMTIDIPIPN